MSRSFRSSAIPLLFGSLILIILQPWSTSTSDPVALATIAARFEELAETVGSSEGLKPGQRNSLQHKLAAARSAYRRGQPCTAANVLEAFLHQVAALNPKKVSPELMADLQQRGVLLLHDLLTSLPPGVTCKQEVEPTDCFANSPWPDLYFESLTPQAALVYEGDGTSLHLVVANRGGQAANSIEVALSSDEVEFARPLLDSVPPCGSTELDVFWPGGELGPHRILADINPDRILAEGTFLNNSAETEVSATFELIRPFEPPDLFLTGLQLSPRRPLNDELVAIEVVVRNQTQPAEGHSRVSNLTVRFLVDGEELEAQFIDSLEPDEEIVLTSFWRATPGRHRIVASGELAGGELDADPDNNSVSDVLHASGMPSALPDLLLEDFQIDPDPPLPGQPLTITAQLTNLGWADAQDVPVEFSVGDFPPEGPLAPGGASPAGDVLPPPSLFRQLINVDLFEAGESRLVEATVMTLDQAEQGVWVEVDPSHLLELVESDVPPLLAKRLVVPSPGGVCRTGQGVWTSLGPSTLTNGWAGHVSDLVIDPGNLQILFASAPTGGIWKTTNGGSSWIPIGDFLPSTGVSALYLDPDDSNILYAGTGAGLLKSLDSGAHWSVHTSGGQIGTGFERIFLKSATGGNFDLYAAGNQGLWHYSGTDRNETSGGGTWSRIKNGSITGVVQHPTDTTLFYVGVYKKGIYRSKSGGPPTGEGSWDHLSDGNYGLPASVPGNIRIAIAPSQPSVLYSSQPNGDNLELYRSENGGDTWTKKLSANREMAWRTPTVALIGGYWENFYNDYLVVHPSYPDTLFMGHIQAYRSDNGGLTLTRIQGIHDDQHNYAFEPGNPDTIYLTGDGGVFKCTSQGASCTHRNNELRNFMFFDIALSPTAPSLVIGGTQDNGTVATNGTVPWKLIRGGDGRYVAIDPQNADRIYSQNQYLNSTAKATNWLANLTASWRGAPGLPPQPGGSPKADIYSGDPYFIIHPSDSDVLLGGGPQAYRHPKATSDWTKCPNCASWSTIGPDPNQVQGLSGNVRRVAAIANTNTYYAGMTSGQIWRTESGGQNWLKIFSHPTGQNLTGLFVDPDDADKLWAAFSGTGSKHGPVRVWLLERIASDIDPDSDEIPPFVFWKATNVTGNLDSAAAIGEGWRNSDMIVTDPNLPGTLYVATTKGVFQGRQALVEGQVKWFWEGYNCNLPWVVVSDIEIHPVTGALYAATYGRGVWVNPLAP